MAATIHNPWRQGATNAEKYNRQVRNLQAEIAQLERSRETQVTFGVAQQYIDATDRTLARRRAKLAALEGTV